MTARIFLSISACWPLVCWPLAYAASSTAPYVAQTRLTPVGEPLFVSGQGGYHTYRIPALAVTIKAL